MPAPYDQICLFGDSITQDSFNQERGSGFSAKLQHAYIRRLDVVNRGFSGYTSRQALTVLPHIIPSPDVARIRILVIFFGANDASLAESLNGQHVPLPEYKGNLEKIITHPLVVAHSPRIMLVAPPPINEHLQYLTDQSKGYASLTRTAASTKSYAEVACEVGEKLGVPVVNLWKAFMEKARFQPEGWETGDPLPGSKKVPQNDKLVELMYDGLHFNPAGYDILFDEFMKVVVDRWPDQQPDNLPMVLPAWNDTAGWKAWSASHT
ncbi:SGNH hydrolase [Lentithecium fluviatile CBS 122367]|uniref:SGNH hydrolase n=1 Tax=Lentithecium fluviatile CBS 122367 TaxID=1168545 RepID=A0A6G1J6X8_9PLEO|nr:SGNH hydrolase [Lentithecium fluviatile CBS 122367]